MCIFVYLYICLNPAENQNLRTVYNEMKTSKYISYFEVVESENTFN